MPCRWRNQCLRANARRRRQRRFSVGEWLKAVVQRDVKGLYKDHVQRNEDLEEREEHKSPPRQSQAMPLQSPTVRW